MYVKAGNRFEYACVTPSNRCQIGFAQSSDENAALCETHPGCRFVPAGECYCPPDVDCFCGGGTPPDCEIDTNPNTKTHKTPPIGHYIVVAVRNASDVAAPLSSPDKADSAIGETISLLSNGLAMSGLGCDSWEISEQEHDVATVSDPMLADINMAPADSPLSAGDQRIMKSYDYQCEGEPFLNVLHVDDRVIVIPWGNSSKYLVAEKPLSAEQIAQLQKQLKSMKFYTGDITGVIDEPTRLAIKFWAEYRSDDDYSFYRPAITENLLDTLGVLDMEKVELD